MAQGTGALESHKSHTACCFIIVLQSCSKALFSLGNRSGFVQLQAGVLMSLNLSLWRDRDVTWAEVVKLEHGNCTKELGWPNLPVRLKAFRLV